MSSNIVALATAPGIAGLAVVRISGDEAITITDKLFKGKQLLSDCKSHTIHYGNFYKNNGELLDSVTCSIFKAPNSYTGENTIEIGCHGGVITSNEIIKELIIAGAVTPTPGEFTKRAFLNGKLDLTQVEAVADLIHSVSIKGSATAAKQLDGNFQSKLKSFRKTLLKIAGLLELELDFSEEDLELVPKKDILLQIDQAKTFCNDLINTFTGSNILRSGYQVAVVGFPNSGKSTLFNTLAEKNRAIVSEIAGTTRDYIEEYIYLKNIPFKLVDTAGLRESNDVIEIQGIKLVESILEQSQLILVLNDISDGINNSNELYYKIKSKYPNTLLIQNKIDLTELNILSTFEDIAISAKDNIGIDKLKSILLENAENSIERVNDALINQRQKSLLEQIVVHLENAEESINIEMENEVIAIDLRSAIKIIGEITGEAWNEEILDAIFSDFCIGK
jgi:tRNA modification GTPase